MSYWCQISFKEIKALSLIANIIKHGEGVSLKSLYECDSSFFKYPTEFVKKFPDSAKYGFKVSEEDFFYFYKVLQNFWNNLFKLEQITLCFKGSLK